MKKAPLSRPQHTVELIRVVPPKAETPERLSLDYSKRLLGLSSINPKSPFVIIFVLRIGIHTMDPMVLTNQYISFHKYYILYIPLRSFFCLMRI